MRVLSDHGTPKTLSLEIYSAMQLYTINEPLLPNLTTLNLWAVEESFIQFIPLFLSPTITSVSFGFSALPESVVASMIANLPTPCPNLRDINLRFLPRDPMITTAVSSMLLATNRNVLQDFHVDSPLTEEASEAIYESQNLRHLSVVIEKGTSVPSASLPNLAHLQIECDDGSDGLQLLRGATFGKLESVSFDMESKPINDFLETFKGAALSSSIQNTLSVLCFSTQWPWNPNYPSLLPFTQLVFLIIQSPCDGSCSRVDDDIVVNLSRAMPKLESLILGNGPCHPFTGGITAKGLMALALNCLDLFSLRVHFRVASLTSPPTGLEPTRDIGHSVSLTDCALVALEVGGIPMPEESAPTVALTLLRIFPRIETISYLDEGWRKVQDMIRHSKEIFDCSSKYHHPTIWMDPLLTLLRSQTYDK